MLDHKYQTFLSCVKTGSYTKTAEELFISQPTVTQHIQKLEREVGYRLFNHVGHHIQPTSRALKLAEFVQSLNAQTKKFIEKQASHAESRNLTFACTLSLSDFLAPHLIQELQGSEDFFQLRCLVANTASALDLVRQGQADFALIEGNFDKHEFGYQVLESQAYIPVCATTNHLLNKPQSYQLEDLLSETIITRENGSGSRHILSNILEAANLQITDFNQIIEIANIAAIKELVKNDVGISFMYQKMALPLIKQDQIAQIPLIQTPVTHEIYFVYLKNTYFARELTNIYQIIRQTDY